MCHIRTICVTNVVVSGRSIQYAVAQRAVLDTVHDILYSCDTYVTPVPHLSQLSLSPAGLFGILWPSVPFSILFTIYNTHATHMSHLYNICHNRPCVRQVCSVSCGPACRSRSCSRYNILLRHIRTSRIKGY